MSTRTLSNIRRLAQFIVLGAVLSTSLFAHAATSTMEQIKQTKQLRIGAAPGDPWYFKDPVSGEWTGVGVMVGQQIAKDLGAKLMPVETTYGNAIAGLQANQIDVMFVLDATDERKKALDFPSNPLLWYKQGVLIKQGVNAKTWDDLNNPNVRLGVSLGSATDRDVTKRLPPDSALSLSFTSSYKVPQHTSLRYCDGAVYRDTCHVVLFAALE